MTRSGSSQLRRMIESRCMLRQAINLKNLVLVIQFLPLLDLAFQTMHQFRQVFDLKGQVAAAKMVSPCLIEHGERC